MLIIIFNILFLILSITPQDDQYSKAREEMVEEQIKDRGITHHATLVAMQTVPRHQFVPDDLIEKAYNDGPLPIGYGQTISSAPVNNTGDIVEAADINAIYADILKNTQIRKTLLEESYTDFHSFFVLCCAEWTIDLPGHSFASNTFPGRTCC